MWHEKIKIIHYTGHQRYKFFGQYIYFTVYIALYQDFNVLEIPIGQIIMSPYLRPAFISS